MSITPDPDKATRPWGRAAVQFFIGARDRPGWRMATPPLGGCAKASNKRRFDGLGLATGCSHDRLIAEVDTEPENAAVSPRILLIEDDRRLAEMVTIPRRVRLFRYRESRRRRGIGLHARRA
jgi:hypothetical protein